MAVIMMDSTMTSFNIEAGFAPIAFRMPNSRVRSRTVINMMLLTPTIPAIKVPIPTIQMKSKIPSVIVLNIRISLPVIHIPMAFLSVGSNMCLRAIYDRNLFSKSWHSSSVETPFTVH